MKTLIFDVTGEFAHFRKFNTTSSPLTYLIPTRTAVAGLLGAIVGFGREEFYDYFLREKAEIAIQAKNKLTKQGYAFNLINTKEGMNRIKNRTQVKFEFVAQPHYRVFFTHTDASIYDDIKSRIQEKRFFFQPYLGLAQLTADLVYVDEVESHEKKSSGFVEIISAVNLKKCTGTKIEIDPDLKYSSAIMPIEMSLDLLDPLNAKMGKTVLPKNRKTDEYAEVVFEVSGRPVKVETETYHELENYGNILFL
ncbi:type I-B CRISPR-associated protein Cas5b [Ignavibacteriales bacterium]